MWWVICWKAVSPVMVIVSSNVYKPFGIFTLLLSALKTTTQGHAACANLVPKFSLA